MIISLFVLCFIAQTGSNEILVQVTEGQIRGVETKHTNGKNILCFKGVPYAKPPIFKLRFEAPEEPGKWQGVRDCTKLPEVCMQYSHRYYTSSDPLRGVEDCLYLNIYTPRIAGSADLNVIVFFHGGAFTFGSGNSLVADYLLDKNDLVLVTVNYRLGPLGFLSTQNKNFIPGNNGLKDQLMALKWVRKNIMAFGGDPYKVTIAGISAGGASVHYHMLSKQSRGYFSKAISLSGTALCPWAQTENSNGKATRLAKNLGCPTQNIRDMVECLKKKPASQIVLQVKNFMSFLYNPFTPFGPVVEPKSPNAFIDESPLSIMTNKKSADVPWLVSFAADEGLYPGADILGKRCSVIILEQNWDLLLPHLLDYENTSPVVNRSLIGEKIKRHYLREGTMDDKTKFIKGFSYNPFTPFGPVVEPKSPNAFIDESPLSLMKNKKSADVPWWVSFDAGEGLYPGAEILGKSFAMNSLEKNRDQFLPSLLDYENTSPVEKRSLIGQKIEKYYLGGGTIDNNKKQFIKMISDRLYLNAIDKTLKTHTKIYSSPVYVYKFSYIGSGHIADEFMAPEIYRGAGHGDDFPYVLRLKSFFKDENREKPMINFMTKIWMNFICGQTMWPKVNSYTQIPDLSLAYLNIYGSDLGSNKVVLARQIGDSAFWNQLNFKEEYTVKEECTSATFKEEYTVKEEYTSATFKKEYMYK